MGILNRTNTQPVRLVYANDQAIDLDRSDFAAFIKAPHQAAEHLAFSSEPLWFEVAAIDCITWEERVVTPAQDAAETQARLNRLLPREAFRWGVRAVFRGDLELWRGDAGEAMPDEVLREFHWDELSWIGERIKEMSEAKRGLGHVFDRLIKGLEYRAALKLLEIAVTEAGALPDDNDALTLARDLLKLPEGEANEARPEDEPGKS